MENKKNDGANDNANDTSDRQLLLTRILDAPIDLVWEVWTKPEHIASWWGPNGFTNTITVMDMRPGGQWNLTMHGPDGTDYRNESVFREVILHKKIVYEHTTSPRFIATVRFEAMGEQTRLTWSMVFRTVDEFIQTVKTFKADEGQKQNVEKLNVYLRNLSLSKK